MDNIRVLFVLPANCKNQNEASEIMLQAYESCKQNVVNVSWIEDAKFDSVDVSKTDFVVFQEFKGKNFESLKETKCARILGPWCLLICLMEGKPIPNFTWPIYNVAMSGCVVSTSHIPKAKKLEIKEKVQLMGGCYTDSLMSTNTHLVTESVKSEKYLQAAETGVKLIVSKWIDAVWEASQVNNVHCDDEQFLKYKCLPFHNLTISATGFRNIEMRTQLAQTIAKNGGVFTASLAVSTTDVLVVYGEAGIMSNKYRAAKSNPNIYCVGMDWITDSIAKGYAVPHNLYTVAKKGTSTPQKEDESGPNFSVISAIGDTTTKCITTVEETFLPKKIQPSILMNRISPNKRKCSTSEVEKIIAGLDIKKAKKAGQYLDGCSVYLAGFKPDQREKLAKILNLSGATRYDDISDRLTHIIIGDPTCPEVKIIKSKNYSVSLVTLHWLLDSMDKQHVADEENYLINLFDCEREQFSSPLGRKGLSLLRTNKTLTSNDVEVANANSEEIETDNNLVQQYLQTSSRNEDTDTLVRFLKDNGDFNSKPNVADDSKQTDNTSTQQSESNDGSTQNTNIFFSKKFIIVNFSTEETQCLKEHIENALGTVVPRTYKGIPDFVVAPAFITSPIQMSALEIVSNIWVFECVQECEDLPIAYYHRPYLVCENKPLENCVVTISGYTAGERNFLNELIETLGGTAQEQFARIFSIEKNVKASTHLVSLEADGKKYNAAVKWGLPVVSKDWLFECAKTGKFVSEENYLLGDSKVPKKSSSSTPSYENSNSKRDYSKSTSNPDKTPNVGKTLTPSTSTGKTRKFSTPLSQMQPLDINKSEKTPINQKLSERVAETPCTQVTPINKLMAEVRKTNLLGTPQTPPITKTDFDVETPTSPFGAFIRPHLSSKSKKSLMQCMNRFADLVPPPKERKSTPLSEIKRRCLKNLLSQQGSPSSFVDNKTESADCQQLDVDITDDNEEAEKTMDYECGRPEVHSQVNSQNVFVNTKLKQIEDMVSAFGENRRGSRTFQLTDSAEVANSAAKDSQPFTVGWDYEEESQTTKQQTVRIFIISGVQNELRQSIVDKIESLGGQVSDLSSYDPQCTHLICPKPARNEKTLSCMAAGKWILHISYVDKCVAAGKFLAEEDFEFGNPRAKENIKMTFDKETESRVQSIYWWRKEIARRGYGAFNDMRAIVVAQKRDPIIRVIEAGGGQVVDAKPPFSENVHATHCLIEVKCVPDFSAYNSLAQRGVLCINTLYISDFLFRTNNDIKDAILPHFSKFYL